MSGVMDVSTDSTDRRLDVFFFLHFWYRSGSRGTVRQAADDSVTIKDDVVRIVFVDIEGDAVSLWLFISCATCTTNLGQFDLLVPCLMVTRVRKCVPSGTRR